jgi:hypothetical protein
MMQRGDLVWMTSREEVLKRALRRWFGELKQEPEFMKKTELMKVSIGDGVVDVLVLGLDTLA